MIHETQGEHAPAQDVETVLVVPDLDVRDVRRGVRRPTWERTGTLVVRGVRTTWGPGGMVVMLEARKTTDRSAPGARSPR